MKIDLTLVIPVAAVVSSVLLLLASKKRLLEVIALAASLAWLLLELGLITWPLKQRFTTPGIVIGATLLVTGIAVYLKTSDKREITASTVIAILGGMLLVPALNHLG